SPACRWRGRRAGGSTAVPRTHIGRGCGSRSARSWCQSYLCVDRADRKSTPETAENRPPRSERIAAESDLVAVGVAEGGLAYAVGVGLAFGRLQAPLGDLGDAGVEVADEEGVHGVPGMFGPHVDVHVPMVGELPHRLRVVGQERRRGAEESLVPGHRRGVITDGDAREQIYGHEVMLASDD